MKWLTQYYDYFLIIITYGLLATAVTLIIYMPFFLKNGWYSNNWRLQLSRVLLIGIITACIIQGLARLPLAEFYCFAFTMPLFICLFCSFFLNEKMHRHHIIGLIIGFIGVIIVTGPQINTLNIGAIFVLIAVISLALNAVIVRKIGKDDAMPYYILPSFVGILVCNLPFFIDGYIKDPSIINIDISFFIVILMSFFYFAGQVLFIIAFSKAPSASVVAPFHYTQLVLGSILGYFLFGDIPGIHTILGGTCIISAGLYIIYKEHQNHLRIQATSSRL